MPVDPTFNYAAQLRSRECIKSYLEVTDGATEVDSLRNGTSYQMLTKQHLITETDGEISGRSKRQHQITDVDSDGAFLSLNKASFEKQMLSLSREVWPLVQSLTVEKQWDMLNLVRETSFNAALKGMGQRKRRAGPAGVIMDKRQADERPRQKVDKSSLTEKIQNTQRDKRSFRDQSFGQAAIHENRNEKYQKRHGF